MKKICEIPGGKIVGIAVYGNQAIIATDTEVFSHPLIIRKERKKLKQPKGNDGDMGGGNLNPEDNKTRAGKEWPPGYKPPPKPKKKEKKK